jgi:hypothetical protein
MSKSNTAVKPVSSTVSAEYQLSPVAPPAYDQTIVDRIGEQHHRIYQVVGAVQIAMRAIDTLDRDGQEDHIVALWSALGLIQDTLEDIASHIEPRVALNQEAAHV